MDQDHVYLDVFSSTVSDQERTILLAPDCPRPLLVQSISDALNEINNPRLNTQVAEKAVGKVLRGEFVPPIVKEFAESLVTKTVKLAPFTDGRDKEYLAIFCGFIDAMKNFLENDPETAKQLVKRFEENATNALKQTPHATEGQQALDIVTGKVRNN